MRCTLTQKLQPFGRGYKGVPIKMHRLHMITRAIAGKYAVIARDIVTNLVQLFTRETKSNTQLLEEDILG
jgi:hypothetical protein